MKTFQRYNVKRFLIVLLWISIGTASLFLLAAGVRTRAAKNCRGLEVRISGVSNNFFIDKSDVRSLIASYVGDKMTDIKITGFNLVSMEKELKKEVWIKDANLFFDNNEILHATIEEREPVARIFTAGGHTCYIDNTEMMLPLSDKLSARLPVFTGFPSETKVLAKADSNLLADIASLSLRIQKDSFLMGMIDQVNITPQRTFEMIPKIGDQLIVFGNASGADEKFSKLKLFYKKVMMKYGWNRYSVISLQYKGQVVGKLKGKDDVSADSARTVQIMHEIAVYSAKAASDSLQTILQDNDKNSTDISIIQQSMEREEPDENLIPFQRLPAEVNEPAVAVVKPEHKPVVAHAKSTVPVIARHTVPKPKIVAKPIKISAKPVKPIDKPKALPKKENDY